MSDCSCNCNTVLGIIIAGAAIFGIIYICDIRLNIEITSVYERDVSTTIVITNRL